MGRVRGWRWEGVGGWRWEELGAGGGREERWRWEVGGLEVGGGRAGEVGRVGCWKKRGEGPE